MTKQTKNTQHSTRFEATMTEAPELAAGQVWTSRRGPCEQIIEVSHLYISGGTTHVFFSNRESTGDEVDNLQTLAAARFTACYEILND